MNGPVIMPDWCPCCGCQDGVHALSQYRDAQLDVCVVCGDEAAAAHALCPKHQSETEAALFGYVPTLLAHLERTAGMELDAYVERGRLAEARWWLGSGVADASHALVQRLFAAYADEEFDARLLYGTHPPSKPDDPRPYLSIECVEAPSWFVDHATPIVERALRDVFATLPTEPVERAMIRSATRREDADTVGLAYEMVFDYLGVHDPPLSADASDLVSFRYHPQGGQWFWFGWDDPDRCWLTSGILPPALQDRLRLVRGRWSCGDEDT